MDEWIQACPELTGSPGSYWIMDIRYELIII